MLPVTLPEVFMENRLRVFEGAAQTSGLSFTSLGLASERRAFQRASVTG